MTFTVPRADDGSRKRTIAVTLRPLKPDDIQFVMSLDDQQPIRDHADMLKLVAKILLPRQLNDAPAYEKLKADCITLHFERYFQVNGCRGPAHRAIPLRLGPGAESRPEQGSDSSLESVLQALEEGRPFACIHGEARSGRTHLLHTLGQRLTSSVKLPLTIIDADLTELSGIEPPSLTALAQWLSKTLIRHNFWLEPADASVLLSSRDTLLLLDGLSQCSSHEQVQKLLSGLQDHTNVKLICVWQPMGAPATPPLTHTLRLEPLTPQQAGELLATFLLDQNVEASKVKGLVQLFKDRLAGSFRSRSLLRAGILWDLSCQIAQTGSLPPLISLFDAQLQPLLNRATAQMLARIPASQAAGMSGAGDQDLTCAARALAWHYVKHQSTDSQEWLLNQRALPQHDALDVMSKALLDQEELKAPVGEAQQRAKKAAKVALRALCSVGLVDKQADNSIQFRNIAYAEVLAVPLLLSFQEPDFSSPDALSAQVVKWIRQPVWRYLLGFLLERVNGHSQWRNLRIKLEKALLAEAGGTLLQPPPEPELEPELRLAQLVVLSNIVRGWNLTPDSVSRLLKTLQPFQSSGLFQRALVIRELERLKRNHLFEVEVDSVLDDWKKPAHQGALDGLILKYACHEALKQDASWLQDETVVTSVCWALLSHLTRLDHQLPSLPEEKARLVLETLRRDLPIADEGSSLVGSPHVRATLSACFSGPTPGYTRPLASLLTQPVLETLLDTLALRELLALLTGARYSTLSLLSSSAGAVDGISQLRSIFDQTLKDVTGLLYPISRPDEPKVLSALRDENIDRNWQFKLLTPLCKAMGFLCAPATFTTLYRTNPSDMWRRVQKSANEAESKLRFKVKGASYVQPQPRPDYAPPETIVRQGLHACLGLVVGMNLDGTPETSAELLAERVSARFVGQCMEEGEYNDSFEPRPTRFRHALLLALGLYSYCVTGQDPQHPTWKAWMALPPEDPEVNAAPLITQFVLALVQDLRRPPNHSVWSERRQALQAALSQSF